MPRPADLPMRRHQSVGVFIRRHRSDRRNANHRQRRRTPSNPARRTHRAPPSSTNSQFSRAVPWLFGADSPRTRPIPPRVFIVWAFSLGLMVISARILTCPGPVTPKALSHFGPAVSAWRPGLTAWAGDRELCRLSGPFARICDVWSERELAACWALGWYGRLGYE
jgi:hypothetical protein